MKTLAVVPCEGYDHLLRVEWSGEGSVDEDVVYVNVYIDVYYAAQIGILEKLWGRAKIIWTVLRGKEYLFEEVIINGAKAREIFNKDLFDE